MQNFQNIFETRKRSFISSINLRDCTFNHCDVTTKRRRFVPVYGYQRGKQQYLLLNDIVPKNREQVLAFERFSDHLDFFYAALLEEREELETLIIISNIGIVR